ncbi:MAG: hypothetical protein NT007_09645 [Candidatus Kapabacteria bacterium]|nr:hypothetical protein [Candidatus Kapabacteria bacterium]
MDDPNYTGTYLATLEGLGNGGDATDGGTDACPPCEAGMAWWWLIVAAATGAFIANFIPIPGGKKRGK